MQTQIFLNLAFFNYIDVERKNAAGGFCLAAPGKILMNLALGEWVARLAKYEI